MHLEGHGLSPAYEGYVRRKRLVLLGLIVLCGTMTVVAVSRGAVPIPLADVARTFLGSGDTRYRTIILSIRLPQALAALLAGGGLAVAGTVMQSALRNPLGSPFTLGISNAAAFGAAFSIIVLGSGSMQSHAADAITIVNPWLATGSAFVASLACMAMVLLLSAVTRGTPDIMVLAGVALSSLFTAGTMFLQYFADDAQLAATVFWTFGDVARASWRDIPVMALLLLGVFAVFFLRRFDLNALECGDETARSLGVRTMAVRLETMVLASLLSSVMVALLGVIGFVGLVCPHMLRRFLGSDHRFLLPGSALLGGFLLLAADTGARMIFAPRTLPVSVFTAFFGAPVFLAILFRRRRP